MFSWWIVFNSIVLYIQGASHIKIKLSVFSGIIHEKVRGWNRYYRMIGFETRGWNWHCRMCSATTLTGEFRFHISTPPGDWTQVPQDGRQTGRPLDQWNCVYILVAGVQALQKWYVKSEGLEPTLWKDWFKTEGIEPTLSIDRLKNENGNRQCRFVKSFFDDRCPAFHTGTNTCTCTLFSIYIYTVEVLCIVYIVVSSYTIIMDILYIDILYIGHFSGIRNGTLFSEYSRNSWGPAFNILRNYALMPQKTTSVDSLINTSS